MGELDPVARDIVSLLRRSPDTFWSPTAVAQQLGIAADVARSVMERLADSRIVVAAEHSSAFRYAPERPS